MKINVEQYFQEAKKLNIEPYQIKYGVSTEYIVAVFNGEVEEQQIGAKQYICSLGIYDGKQGKFATDCIDKNTPALLAKKVYENSLYANDSVKTSFVSEHLKYKKIKMPKEKFQQSTIEDLRKFSLSLYDEIKDRNPLLNPISVETSMVLSEGSRSNSYGVSLSSKRKIYYCSFSVGITKDNDTRTASQYVMSYISLDDLRLEADKVIDRVISDAVDFVGSTSVKSKQYKAIFDRDCIDSLLRCYLSQLNAKMVEKHLSIFEDKINTQITSKCLTIKNTPHRLSPSATIADSESYPTQDFTIVKNGILQTYFHSLETAKNMNVQPNGCATGNGNASFISLSVKPSKLSIDDLFNKMNNGLYVTSISGLNSGLNSRTMDFSLPCEGYVIENGKMSKTFSMMVVAGNLKDLFNSVVAISNDIDEKQGQFIPSMLIKKISFAGN